MNVLDPEKSEAQDVEESDVSRLDDAAPSTEEKEAGHGGHSRWMMIACCIPMLAIAVVIAASGAGFGFLVLAVMCTAMMALMMGRMSQGGGGGD